jgi:formylglycine-generating enzyme required for sulfatase activity
VPQPGDLRRSLVMTLSIAAVAAAGFGGAWLLSTSRELPGLASNHRPSSVGDGLHLGPSGERMHSRPVATDAPAHEQTARPSGPIPEPPADPRENMVLIPAGEFLFGEGRDEVELPDYYIDRCEVSQEEYAKFLEYIHRTGDHSHCDRREPKGKDHTPLNWGRPDLSGPSWPVVGIDYWDCLGYAGWVGKRLPTEVEWEKAARGTDGRLYPWGDEWDVAKANWGQFLGDHQKLVAVDSMPEGRSPYGCYHMLGNAAEWTASFLDEAKGIHCGRGFCWRFGHDAPHELTFRMPGGTHLRDEGSGLRCALDAQ